MRRSNKNPEGKISIAILDMFKINRTYYRRGSELLEPEWLNILLTAQCPTAHIFLISVIGPNCTKTVPSLKTFFAKIELKIMLSVQSNRPIHKTSLLTREKKSYQNCNG